MTVALLRRGNLDAEVYIQGECQVKKKAEIRAVLLQAKECQRLPAEHQNLGEKHGTDSHSPQKDLILPTSCSDLQLPEL